jgi:ribonuclease HII
MARKVKVFVGIDEVGRGPLAGPMTIAAVAIVRSDKWRVRSDKLMQGIRDSKKLSPKRREEWFQILRREPQFFIAHASVSHRIIDRRGLSHAARFAVAQCLKKISQDIALSIPHYHVLLDAGLYAPSNYSQERIIMGDEKIPLIAAASIIAKVTRDKHMVQMHKKYPAYGFAQHKGYGTRAHIALIKKHGLSKIQN